MLRFGIIGLLIAISAVALAPAAMAQNILEQLVNPGPLAEAHAKLESTCTSCHTPFSRTTQNGLCLDCHKPVAADLNAHSGFHGRSPEIGASQCRRCHTDHKGRAFSILFFDAELFDHALTEFALTGGHAGLICAKCHQPQAKFRAAPTACDACHGKDDPHKGELGSACAECHDTGNWRLVKAASFDHAKTNFPLQGFHAKADCRACHAGARYTNLPLTCIGCHKPDDIHAGKLGPNCQDCHTSESWKQVTFDHDKTTFPLHGAHKKVTCDGCHSPEPAKDKLPITCIGCHKKDDVHKGTFGADCASCHNETNWKDATKFDHDKTTFPLVGRHARVACAECHKTKDFKAAPTLCQDCHQDTFHKGRLGPDCASCHSSKGWLLWHFDHNTQTRFALTGAHVGLDCHACHAKAVTGKPTLSAVCGTCHKKDDVHRGSFGQNCGRCHNTRRF